MFLFEGIPEIEKKKIMSHLPPSTSFEKGDELYLGDRLAFLLSGSATVFRRGETGSSLPIRNLNKNDCFGAASLFGNWHEGLSSVVAKTKGEIIYISEAELRNLMQKFPEISVNYIKFLSDRIRFLNKRLDLFSADTTERTLLEYLWSNCDKNKRVTLTLSMSELAKRLSIGRSSLYRGLEELEKSGKIKRNKNIIQIKGELL